MTGGFWLFQFVLMWPSDTSPSWLNEFPRAAVTKDHTLGCLKKIEIYGLTVLEAKSLKSKCQQGHVPAEGSREVVPSVFLTNFW